MRISDWSSDVCSSDLVRDGAGRAPQIARQGAHVGAFAAMNLENRMVPVRLSFQRDGVDRDAARLQLEVGLGAGEVVGPLSAHLDRRIERRRLLDLAGEGSQRGLDLRGVRAGRSEEHTSELQSL